MQDLSESVGSAERERLQDELMVRIEALVGGQDDEIDFSFVPEGFNVTARVRNTKTDIQLYDSKGDTHTNIPVQFPSGKLDSSTHMRVAIFRRDAWGKIFVGGYLPSELEDDPDGKYGFFPFDVVAALRVSFEIEQLDQREQATAAE